MLSKYGLQPPAQAPPSLPRTHGLGPVPQQIAPHSQANTGISTFMPTSSPAHVAARSSLGLTAQPLASAGTTSWQQDNGYPQYGALSSGHNTLQKDLATLANRTAQQDRHQQGRKFQRQARYAKFFGEVVDGTNRDPGLQTAIDRSLAKKQWRQAREYGGLAQALFRAVAADDPNALAALVAQGVDVVGTRNGAGETALEMAATRGKRRAHAFISALVGEQASMIASLAQSAARAQNTALARGVLPGDDIEAAHSLEQTNPAGHRYYETSPSSWQHDFVPAPGDNRRAYSQRSIPPHLSQAVETAPRVHLHDNAP